MSQDWVWYIAFFCLGMILGYVAKVDAKPGKFVVVRQGHYLSRAGEFEDWTGHVDKAFHFSTYDIAESAALGVGGRVQEYKP